MTDKNMFAANYLRVSTEEQSANGFGLDAQRSRCNGMADAKAWAVVGEFIDDISGTIPVSERPGFSALLQAIVDGNVNVVIVAQLDRLGRTQRIVLDTIDILADLDCDIVSCKETFDTSTSVGRFVLRMFASLAELDRDNIVERTTAGRNARGSIDGERGGAVPMGYIRTDNGPVIEPTEASIIKRIFNLRESGMILTDIADDLNAHQLKTKRGSTWYASTVNYVLHNEDKYRGGNRWESDHLWPVILE